MPVKMSDREEMDTQRSNDAIMGKGKKRNNQVKEVKRKGKEG